MNRETAFAAKRLVTDETMQQVIAETLAMLTKQLLSAKTPEERETKFQEFKGLERVWNSLKLKAAEADKP